MNLSLILIIVTALVILSGSASFTLRHLFTVSAYLAPVSPKGFICAWRGKHSSWRHGFVVRLFWLGFVVRWGYRKHIGCVDYHVNEWDWCE